MTSATPMLAVAGLSWSVDGTTILDDVSLQVGGGEVVAITGPNGSGKSSLLRCLYGVVRPDAGEVLLDGRPLSSLRPIQAARTLAVVTQEQDVEPQLSVADVVGLGRLPYGGWFGLRAGSGWDAAERCAVTGLWGRTMGTLSGGERQRVQVARALAQEPRVLLLDEPTNHLDLNHQLAVLDLVGDLGLTTVCVLHDLNLVARLAGRVLVMSQGRVVADGVPAEVLTPELIRRVWRVEVEVLEGHAQPVIHPLTRL